ncbi:response regulator (plasmid) [Kovacikia minuta CCNUW1]|uniref:response regulator n=1 Tax=Kovacikia minuta TaxID=2931930 RepID=UPI001CCE5878|nr:response regulator [Kovacikia minuta]UBF30455.1 response regulator [Kovacikia minuta CCNUW1]
MKILVVEDDGLTAEALVATLSNQNYTVEVASDGEAGWALAEAFAYDLILLDVTLPKLDGIRLCQRLRSQGYQMPILLLTARHSSHDKAVGLDAGADDYVVKPFDPEELAARIRALLRRNQTTVRSVLEWGDLRLDPSSCEATYATQLLALTAKEYALLELFLRNHQRVFSCGAILENLWSFEETPSDEAVRTHIKGLRQKLKAAGAPANLIETVYGMGYRLKPLEKAEGRRQRAEAEQAIQKQPLNRSSSEPVEVSAEEIGQQTWAAIAEVWQRFQPRVNEQITVLEQAATALSNQTLNQELQQQAEQEAHTLAGSLGTFGFEQASQLARTIEQQFQAGDRLNSSQIQQLRQMIVMLRQEVAEPEKQEQSLPQTEKHPLLLIIDRDRAVAESVMAEAANWGLRAAWAVDLAIARESIQREQPNVVLLDLAISQHPRDSFNLLAELHQQLPPIPVLVFTSKEDLQHRLEATRLGGRVFLQKPLPATQVLKEVTRILHQADPVDARVMVVDDDPQLLATVRTLLQPWGLHVTTLDNPNQFWETLAAAAPDLLILDIKMPKISGIELCQVVRNDARWSGLPIVILTAYTDANTVNQVFAAGADDFISKPIVGPELVTRILNRLERLKLLKNVATLHQTEVAERKKAETALRKVKDELEIRVAERTAELVSVNEQLRAELNERKQIEEALRVSQIRFSGILDIADDAVISIDGKQRITLFNQGAEKIFGYTAQEAIGQPLDLLLPVRFAAVHQRHVNDFGQSTSEARRMGERREIFGRRKNGEDFPAEASISKLQLKGETIFTVILRDTSDRKVIERMKDEFISIVSHELRTPLTSIHGSLGMLTSGLLDAEPETGKRLLEIAVDSTERLIRLINDVLDVERIESGKVTMDKQTCNVADLMTNAANVMQAMAAKFGVTLSVMPLLVEVWADSDRIIQTLTNLLSNAIKFSPSGATVWVEAERIERERVGEWDGAISNTLSHPTPSILFTVKDQGRGIPSDKLETIFERFQQVDASDSRNQEGTGLGLAICRNIVQQHGGRIWVESTLGEGSTFYFTLPVGEG